MAVQHTRDVPTGRRSAGSDPSRNPPAEGTKAHSA
eukprot:CAMPEP_0206169630 /NCGR_PEP_ID=MMETSP1474-20131121/36359_1 /ASSEMBLY_ACC=CAM_ASM_001110 /TAXON_ID=97495 /ORGANISM="Imantonia sp., Strain RCC918" /LENGTH=34 /DNA_ID= /DNA_START= /DNA_END= /DNA_ORIENTATION=